MFEITLTGMFRHNLSRIYSMCLDVKLVIAMCMKDLQYKKLYTGLSFSFLLKKYTTFFQRSRILTINLDLIVLHCLSSLISGHTRIPPSILFFSIKNLQGSPTCDDR